MVVWESALKKLHQHLLFGNIIYVLKLSVDGLDDKQKNVFIDLTFFTMEGGEASMNQLRQLYGSSVKNEINVLKERSLISFNHNGYIVMHDLVREIEFQISRQELHSSPRTHFRQWRHRDIYDSLICGKIPTEHTLSCASSRNKKQKHNSNDRDDLLLKAMEELAHKLSEGLKEASERLEMHIDRVEIDRVEREKRLDGMKESLYVELMKVEGLTHQERLSADFKMISDDSILVGFYAMPQEGKVDVIRQKIA